jgi:hypothetical protein
MKMSSEQRKLPETEKGTMYWKKGQSTKKYVVILDVYAPKHTTAKWLRQKQWTKKWKNTSTFIFGDFNIPSQ